MGGFARAQIALALAIAACALLGIDGALSQNNPYATVTDLGVKPRANCGEAAFGCPPDPNAESTTTAQYEKLKKGFKKVDKAQPCDIIVYFVSKSDMSPTHFAVIVDVDKDGKPIAVIGQTSHRNLTLTGPFGQEAETSAEATPVEYYTPGDNYKVDKPSQDDIDKAQADVKKADPKTDAKNGKNGAWYKYWNVCHERNNAVYALSTRTASVIRVPTTAVPVSTGVPADSQVGLYAGAEIIGNFGEDRSIERLAATNAVTNDFDNFGSAAGAGVNIGYGFRPLNNIVAGPFVSFDYLNQTINQTFAGGTYLGTTSHWILTAGGKIGITAAPGVTGYALAGGSFLNQSLNINFGGPITSQKTTTPGFTAGFGGEVSLGALSGNLGMPVSLFIEYQHTWWQDANLTMPAASPFFNYTFRRDDNTIKAGINVYFGQYAAPAPAPPPVFPVKALPSK